MKKFIIIGIIVFVVAGIFVHDAVVEKQNRNWIKNYSQLEVWLSNNERPQRYEDWQWPTKFPSWNPKEKKYIFSREEYLRLGGPGEYMAITSEGAKYKKAEPVELIFTDPYTGTPYGLLDRLSAIEKRLAEIEKMQHQSEETKKRENKLTDIFTDSKGYWDMGDSGKTTQWDGTTNSVLCFDWTKSGELNIRVDLKWLNAHEWDVSIPGNTDRVKLENAIIKILREYSLNK